MSVSSSKIYPSRRVEFEQPLAPAKQHMTTAKTALLVHSGNHIFNLEGFTSVRLDRSCFCCPAIQLSYSDGKIHEFGFEDTDATAEAFDLIKAALQDNFGPMRKNS